MLLEFSCTNFKSIKDKIVLSMIASSDDENEDLLYEIINTKVKTKVLNSAVIYGANGSGKTNLIQAIVFMRNLVVESIYNLPGYLINQLPHKLKSINDDSIFNMQFITKGKRYAYGFVLNNCKIKEEYLYVFPNGRQLKIFERINNEILSGDKYKGKFELCKSALQENKLLLTCAAAFTSIDEIKDVFTFFSEDLVIYTGNPSIGNWLSHSLDLIHQDKKIKENVLHLLQQLDTGIKDINIELDDITQKYSDSVMMLSDVVPNNVVNNKNKYLKTSVVYDQFEIDLLNEESMGIKKLVEFICPLIDIIINGKVLLCDEIEASLHESIVYKIFEFFKNNKKYSKNFSQIISTTHDSNLLNLELFRRDQIWFTELKKEDRSTDLYSLSDIKNVRKDENIRKGYMLGKYGGIPMLNNKVTPFINE